jgi:hypothetical protein
MELHSVYKGFEELRSYVDQRFNELKEHVDAGITGLGIRSSLLSTYL